MKADDKILAESVLKRLCVGAQVDGIRFGPVLQMLITHHGEAAVRGQVYLNLGSRWTVFKDSTRQLPISEDELPEMTEEQQLAELCRLRGRVIREAKLGEDAPHLLLTLEDGSIFFLNGYHEQYETWDMGVAMGNPKEHYQVVATPGGGVAVWAP